jgi:hypothetical protein
VWRVALVLSLLAVGACAGRGGEPAPLDMGEQVDLTLAACVRDCPDGCPAGQTCIRPSAGSGFAGFCAVPCTVTQDCPNGDQRCVDIVGQQLPRACASWTVPSACPQVSWDSSCAPAAAACADANVLTRPVSWTLNNVCGVEHVACDHGCVVGPLDGGTVSAHCL